MTTETRITTVCDLLHDREVTGATPVRFGLAGHVYQLDLCPPCTARLRTTLGEFIARARQAGAAPQLLPQPGEVHDSPAQPRPGNLSAPAVTFRAAVGR